jgi:hypothetical protein
VQVDHRGASSVVAPCAPSASACSHPRRRCSGYRRGAGRGSAPLSGPHRPRLIFDAALGLFVYRPEVQDELGLGAQGCLHVCCQVLGPAGPPVPDLPGLPAAVPVKVGVELLLPGGEPVQQLGRELGEPPVDAPEAFAPQRKGSAVIRREPDDPGKGVVPAKKIIIAGVPPGVLVHGWSFFHRGPEEIPAVAAAEQEDEPLRTASGPWSLTLPAGRVGLPSEHSGHQSARSAPARSPRSR